MGYTGTTNYGFQKPAKTNSFNVDDLNNALDKIDETIKKIDNIPEGMGLLNLQWLTPDRLNIEGAIFKGQGPNGESFTVEGGADGRAEKLVSTGRWTVSVEHSGTYDNDKPQIVDVESAQSYLLLYGAATMQGGIVVPVTLASATMKVVNVVTQDVVYNGAFEAKTINTGAGTFDITMTQVGTTQSVRLLVSGQTLLDISEFTVKITIPDVASSITKQVYVDDVPVGLSSPIYVLKTASNKSIKLELTKQWVSGELITFKVNQSLSQNVVIGNSYSEVHVIETSGAFVYPIKGSYEVAIMGGGGGGGGGGGKAYSSSSAGAGAGGGGGGSGGSAGELRAIRESHSEGDSVQITIGSGGEGGNGGTGGSSSNGRAGYGGDDGGNTIFGSVSVSGGESGQVGCGGYGGTSKNSGAAHNGSLFATGCSNGYNPASGASSGGGGGGSGGKAGAGYNGVRSDDVNGNEGGDVTIFDKVYSGGDGGTGGGGGIGSATHTSNAGAAGHDGNFKKPTFSSPAWLFDNANNGAGSTGGNGGRGGYMFGATSKGGNGGFGGVGGNGIYFAVTGKWYGSGGNGGGGGNGGDGTATSADSGYAGTAGTAGINGCVAMRVKL